MAVGDLAAATVANNGGAVLTEAIIVGEEVVEVSIAPQVGTAVLAGVGVIKGVVGVVVVAMVGVVVEVVAMRSWVVEGLDSPIVEQD